MIKKTLISALVISIMSSSVFADGFQIQYFIDFGNHNIPSSTSEENAVPAIVTFQTDKPGYIPTDTIVFSWKITGKVNNIFITGPDNIYSLSSSGSANMPTPFLNGSKDFTLVASYVDTNNETKYIFKSVSIYIRDNATCASLFSQDNSLTNGYYYISPESYDHSTKGVPYLAYCDMDNEGWTRFDDIDSTPQGAQTANLFIKKERVLNENRFQKLSLASNFQKLVNLKNNTMQSNDKSYLYGHDGTQVFTMSGQNNITYNLNNLLGKNISSYVNNTWIGNVERISSTDTRAVSSTALETGLDATNSNGFSFDSMWFK